MDWFIRIFYCKQICTNSLLQQRLLVATIFFCFLYQLSGQGQFSTTGVPIIRNYSPDEYNGHNQNWAISQDDRGIIYIGNNYGLIEYDGVDFRTITPKFNAIVRSMDISDDNIVFVGSHNDIGYLSPDSSHQLQYVSLVKELPDEVKEFADVWQTHCTSEGIFFVTSRFVFRWNGSKMTIWKSKPGFHVGFNVNGKFYVREKSVGLKHVIGDSLALAPIGETFADERIMAMLPLTKNGQSDILLSTRTNGLLRYNGSTVMPWKTEVDDLLKNNQVYCGTKVNDNLFAFGTLQNGVIILDANGRLIHHLNKNSGLQDETIWYLYPDHNGNLWVGMHVGFSSVEINSPVTQFSEQQGLEGSVLELVRNNNRIYGISTMGAFFLDDLNDGRGDFKKVEGVAPQGWSLTSFGKKIIAATFEGVFEINGVKGTLIDSIYGMTLRRSSIDTNRIWIGLQQGIKSLYNQDGKWFDEGRVDNMDQEILWIHETSDGEYWLTTRNIPLVHLQFENGRSGKPLITYYDTTHGLPLYDRTVAFESSKGLRFGTRNGFYKFDPSEKYFFRDSLLVKGAPARHDIFTISPDKKGNLWIATGDISGIARLQPDGTYLWEDEGFKRIQFFDNYFLYPDPAQEGVAWIGCLDRIIRFDSGIKPIRKPFRTLIRKVLINGDSIIYGGALAVNTSQYILRPNYKSLRVYYSAPTYDETSLTVYRYKLEGFDSQWSEWNTETYKDFTGLPPGQYQFLVESKNIYEETGEVAALSFRIIPPFYLSWWAWIIYAVVFGGLIYAGWRYEIRRLRKKHQQQLKVVELDKLKELDQLKSRFFADISHEFRTPLTLILGPVENLLSSNPNPNDAKQFHLIKRNALRLLRLINQLLDLSKLDAGKMQLHLQREDLVTMCKGLIHSFESLGQTKSIQLSFVSQLDHAMVSIDRDKIEQVISNLISNAVKFTKEGGSVRMNLSVLENENFIQINVADTGAGISQEQLTHVFDRFYQGDEAAGITEPGTGIGLALAKELVELHNGKITVSSKPDEGTTFTVLLPYDPNAQQPLRSVSEVHQIAIELQPDIHQGESMRVRVDETMPSLLLVEDNPDMREFIKDALSANYRIIQAADGNEGVEKAIETIPDIIISDIMMPHKDGLALTGELKADIRTSHIPILLLTAKADIESKLAGLRRGADDYVAKPFNQEELRIRTHNILENRKRFWSRFTTFNELPAPTTEDEKIEDEFILRVRSYIETHLSDANLEVDGLAREFGMSRSQFFRKIKALTDQSPSHLIRSIRLQTAKTLLETTGKNVAEVAYAVGFSTPTYFSDAFTENFGIRPSQLKK